MRHILLIMRVRAFISILFCLPFCLSGQGTGLDGTGTKTIVFSYDNSGNQIMRQFVENFSPIQDKNEPQQELPLSELFEKAIIVYPNPTRGLFYIEWEKEISNYIFQVRVLSASAVLQLLEVKNSENKLSIDLTLSQSGIYFVQFIFTDQSIVSKKIIKL